MKNVSKGFEVQYTHTCTPGGRFVNMYKSRIVKKRSTAEAMIKKLESSPIDFSDIRLIILN